MNRAKKDRIIAYAVLVIIGILFLLPLTWVVLASLDTNATVAAKIPNLTVQNYVGVLRDAQNYRAFGSGLLISIASAFLTVILAGLMAYPLSRYEMKHKKMFMLTMLFMTCLPITTVMVPVYQVFVMLGLYDTFTGLILFLTASNLPYAIWMMKNFMDSVPISLEEAAWIDGADRIGGLIHVIMPLMFGGISSVAIFVFSGCWGNFLVPFLLLGSADKTPAAVKLYRYFGTHTVSYGELAAFSIIYAIPSIILYVLSQKHMSKGFAMEGGAKG